MFQLSIPTTWLDAAPLKFLYYAVLIAGVFKVTHLVLGYGAMLLDLFLLPPVNFKKYGAKQGNWAIITGASDGIGKEFSKQLAKKGFNVFLVSRTESKLKELASSIKENYKVDAKILAADLSVDNQENYNKIKDVVESEELKGKVSILVNNVGASHSIPVSFEETPEKELETIVLMNNLVTLKITQTLIPYLKETRGKSLILTMGSFSGLIPTPFLATYSGSKAFLQNWSTALAQELSPKIDVELVVSYLVTSAMSKIRRTSASIPNPKAFVASTLRNVGRRCGAQSRYATITPYWSHALMHWWIENTVGLYSKLVVKINYNMHRSIRQRALKKAAREAKKQ